MFIRKRKAEAVSIEEVEMAKESLVNPNGDQDFESIVNSDPGILKEISLFDVLDSAWPVNTAIMTIMWLVDHHKANPNETKGGTYLADEVWKRYGYKVGDDDTPMTDIITYVDGIEAPKFAKTLFDRLMRAAESGKLINYKKQQRGPSRGEWESLKKRKPGELYWHIISGEWSGDVIQEGVDWLYESQDVKIPDDFIVDYISTTESRLGGSNLLTWMLERSSTESASLNKYLTYKALKEDKPDFYLRFLEEGRIPKTKFTINEMIGNNEWKSGEILGVLKKLRAKGYEVGYGEGDDNIANLTGWNFGVKNDLFDYIVDELGVMPTDDDVLKGLQEKEKNKKELEQLAIKPERIPFGQMTIYNGGIVESDMNEIMGGMRKLKARLTSKGFGHLMYGPVVVVPQEMPGKVFDESIYKYKDVTAAAFYYPLQDMLVVNAESFLTDIYNGMQIMAHELGHRQWYKFLDTSQRQRWHGNYEERGIKITPGMVKHVISLIYSLVPYNTDDLGYRFRDWREFDERKLVSLLENSQDKYFSLDIFDFAAAKDFSSASSSQRKKWRHELIDFSIGRWQEIIDSFADTAKYLDSGDKKYLTPSLMSWERGQLENHYRRKKEEYEKEENEGGYLVQSVVKITNRFFSIPSSTTEYGRNNEKEDYAEAFGNFMANKAMPAEIYELFMGVHGLRRANRIARNDKVSSGLVKLAKNLIAAADFGDTLVIDPMGSVIDLGGIYHDAWFSKNWERIFPDVENNEDTIEYIPDERGWVRVRYYHHSGTLSIQGRITTLKRRGDKLMDIVLDAMDRKSSKLIVSVGTEQYVKRFKMSDGSDGMGDLMRVL